MIAPVVLIFYNRPETLEKVFEVVRQVRPEKLYLVQDAPPKDECYKENWDRVINCRKIVENIDWECKVEKNFASENMGCGMRPYTGIDWVFSKEDQAIILEDDCIPSLSFFRFCTDLLNKYENDDRVFMISGLNMEEETRGCDDSYFFAYSGTNCGWATWKRNWNKMDYSLKKFREQDKKQEICAQLKQFLIKLSGQKGEKEYERVIQTAELLASGAKITYWDLQWQIVRYLQHQISIVPQKNLITNIGVGEYSTHAKHIRQHKRKKKINALFNRRFELEFPLKHPEYMIPNVEYDHKIDRWINPPLWEKVIRRIKIRLF